MPEWNDLNTRQKIALMVVTWTCAPLGVIAFLAFMEMSFATHDAYRLEAKRQAIVELAR